MSSRAGSMDAHIVLSKTKSYGEVTTRTLMLNPRRSLMTPETAERMTTLVML